ncbi:MAG: NAD-dependent epimerase/dehydratase family protein [Clostridia bacterium]|nr:NAD-dependent epimerase/dehydratase family protein [Clostridia bacterium]
MKILVTGADGFIGKNLVREFKNQDCADILEFHKNGKSLEEYTRKCKFIFHLAGVNRPKNEKDFAKNNIGFTSDLIGLLEKYEKKVPIVFASSVQAKLNNPYGRSKRIAEKLILGYAKRNDTKAFIYRLPNVFGKWARPNYNSVVATFCHNISHDMPISVNEEADALEFAYIDDVVSEFTNLFSEWENRTGGYCHIKNTYEAKPLDIAALLYSFKEGRKNFNIPNMSDVFARKLYSTYLSYLPKNAFSYSLKKNTDERGSFSEFIKAEDFGQVSVNIINPGAIKGNHWHHTKSEKFLVVRGKGVIRLRNILESEIVEYFVEGDKLEVVDIPPGYVHNIENLGNTDMVTIMWASEPFNPQRADTYFSEV